MNVFERYQVIEATFQPKHQDTLRPGAVPLIGTRTKWRCLWLIEEEDGGAYVGQHAWEWVDREFGAVGWVPTEDLADVAITS